MECKFTKDDTLIAKGIAIILMYIHHLYTFQDRILDGNYYSSFFLMWGNTFEYWIGTFGKICVCIFIFLSGFATYKTYIRNGKYDFIKEKLIKFYRIYLIVFIVFVPIGYILKLRSFDIFEAANNILCITSTYNREWWFARAFICIMLLFPLIIKIFGKNESNIVSDCVKIMLLAAFVTTIFPNIMNFEFLQQLKSSQYYIMLNQAITLIPSFLCGCICAKYNLLNKYREVLKNRVITFIISVIVLIIVFDFRSKTGVDISWDYIYAPLVIIASTSIIKELSIIKKIFIAIGQKSTYMWLTHSFFCYYYFQTFTYGLHNSLLILLWLLGVTYLVAYILNKLNNLINVKTFTLLKEKTIVLTSN